MEALRYYTRGLSHSMTKSLNESVSFVLMLPTEIVICYLNIKQLGFKANNNTFTLLIDNKKVLFVIQVEY